MNLHRRFFIFIIISIFLTGCDNNSSNNNSPTDDPGLAHSWTVSLEAPANSGLCFKPGQSVSLNITVYNHAGAILSNPDITITGDLSDAMFADNNGHWPIDAEGEFEFFVTFNGETTDDSTITPVTLHVISDQTPPALTVFAPARAAMLTSNVDVRVEAQVLDATSTLASVSLNGEELLDENDTRQLDIDVTPVGIWGLNMIELVATDYCGNSVTHSQSYLRSEQYLTPATSPVENARVPNGHSLRLAQQVVDDNNRSDLNDLATLMERYLERNIDSLLKPNTASRVLYEQSGVFCDWITQVRISSAGISVTYPNVTAINLIDNGLSHLLAFDSVSMPLDIRTRVYNPLNCSYTSAEVNATVRLDMDVSAETLSSVSNGAVSMLSQSPQVIISNLTVSATGVSAIDSILSSLLNLFRATISDAIEDQLAAILPELDEALINPLLSGTLSLSGEGYGFNLSAITGIDNQLIDSTAITQTAFAQVYPAIAAQADSQQGSISRPIAAATFASANQPLTYAINDNLINNGLWALWYGGNLQLEDIFGMPGIRMQVNALLPPVLMPGNSDDQSVLALGDLQVSLDLTLAEGTLAGVTGELSVQAFVSQYLAGTFSYSASSGQLEMMTDAAGSQSFVQITSALLDGKPITSREQAEQIHQYAENLINSTSKLLLNDSLLSIPLPPLTLDFSQYIGGGSVTAINLAVQEVNDEPDGIVIGFLMQAQSTTLPGGSEFFSTNHRWTVLDSLLQGIPIPIAQLLVYPLEGEESSPYTTTVAEYRAKLDECSSAGLFGGKEKCLDNWQEPLDYGWYCGAGRPVDGFLVNPILDPVDFCCRLHDRNIFDPKLEALSPINACGFAMCLQQASASNADIFQVMPKVERARIKMYNRAGILCSSGGPGIIMPIGDPYIGNLPE